MLDDQGDDKAKEKQLKGGSDISKTKFLRIDSMTDIIAISAIYFVEGALGLARLTQTFLLKDVLHVGPAEMSVMMGILALLWTVKPLYGFLSNGFPIALQTNFKRELFEQFQGKFYRMAISIVAGSNHKFLNILDMT